jgi:hypothetical protein
MSKTNVLIENPVRTLKTGADADMNPSQIVTADPNTTPKTVGSRKKITVRIAPAGLGLKPVSSANDM